METLPGQLSNYNTWNISAAAYMTNVSFSFFCWAGLPQLAALMLITHGPLQR